MSCLKVFSIDVLTQEKRLKLLTSTSMKLEKWKVFQDRHFLYTPHPLEIKRCSKKANFKTQVTCSPPVFNEIPHLKIPCKQSSLYRDAATKTKFQNIETFTQNLCPHYQWFLLSERLNYLPIVVWNKYEWSGDRFSNFFTDI